MNILYTNELNRGTFYMQQTHVLMMICTFYIKYFQNCLFSLIPNYF
jgi:hypothetical protein